jgi:hypothetical protein
LVEKKFHQSETQYLVVYILVPRQEGFA